MKQRPGWLSRQAGMMALVLFFIAAGSIVINERLTQAGHPGLLEYPTSWLRLVNASLVHGFVAMNHPQLSTLASSSPEYEPTWTWIFPLMVLVIFAVRLGNLLSFSRQPDADCTVEQTAPANQHLDQLLGCIIVLVLWFIELSSGSLSHWWQTHM